MEVNMKNKLLPVSLLLAITFVCMIGMVSAVPQYTMVSGQIANNSNGTLIGIPNAIVTITCHDSINGDVNKTATTRSDGSYSVAYTEGSQFCSFGSYVDLMAVDGSRVVYSYNNQVSQSINMGFYILNLGVANGFFQV